jgi:hypothetical protein
MTTLWKWIGFSKKHLELLVAIRVRVSIINGGWIPNLISYKDEHFGYLGVFGLCKVQPTSSSNNWHGETHL